jgi:hypothetical protein
MAKNIVLLSDGTGKRGGVGSGTNVWRLHRALVQDDAQLVCYDDGVGSQDFTLFKTLGGALGLGLGRNVCDLYTFLVRQWEPGDRIYLLGFSRGAFTVRLLAGMIVRCGVLDLRKARSNPELYALVRAAYSVYRASYFRPSYAEHFRTEYSREVDSPDRSIHFLGVWDTVDAMGVPVDELRDVIDRILRYSFRDRVLSEQVGHGCHAVAIDDNRKTFHPVMWDERLEKSESRIEQVWFAGVHSNVGGGYPKPQMALVTLDWMIDRIRAWDEHQDNALSPGERLRFHPDELRQIREEADVHGRLYDSRAGLAALYRYVPRDMDTIRQEYARDAAVIHESAMERIRRATDGYAPHNLAARSHPLEDVLSPPETRDSWDEAMRHARSITWLRRAMYYVLLLVTVVILALPWLPGNGSASETGWAGIWRVLVAPVEWLLPGAAGRWMDGLAARPYLGPALIGLLLLLIWQRQRQKAWQAEIAHAGWASVYGDHRPSGEGVLARARESSVLSRLGLWSESRRLARFGNVLRCLAVRLAVIVLYLPLRIGRVIHEAYRFRVLDRRVLREPLKLDPGGEHTLVFETRDFLRSTGLRLEAGASYRITVDAWAGWSDADHEAKPEGVTQPDRLPRLVRLARSLFRGPKEPVFALLGRVGGVLGETVRVGREATLTPRRDGDLHLFVNDANFLIPPFHDVFYANNRGVARIRVRRLPGDGAAEGQLSGDGLSEVVEGEEGA